MTERPNAVLALLLTLAVGVAAAIAAALAATSLCHVDGHPLHLGGFFSGCLVFVHELQSVPLAALASGVLVAISALAFLRALRRAWREHRVLRRLPLRPADRMAIAAAVDVYVLPSSRPLAFSFGLVRPRVVVSSALLSELSPAEQAAAIWHEAHHVRHHEPLKCFIARLAASTFFWLPLLADLLERYLLAKELTADRLAARKAGVAALAGALSAAVPSPAATAGLADFASARIQRLFDPDAELPQLFSRRRLVLSTLVASCLALTLLLPATVDLTQAAHLRTLVELFRLR
jgi:Zn-dependent protease with chaperone function